jgi:hypothetical protein
LASPAHQTATIVGPALGSFGTMAVVLIWMNLFPDLRNIDAIEEIGASVSSINPIRRF